MRLIFKLMNKILKIVFNRIFYVALALLIQLTWIFLTVWRLAGYSRYISMGITVLTMLVILWLVSKDINPSYKLAWTILIMAVPVFGLVLFLLFGTSRVAREMEQRFEVIRKSGEEYLKGEERTRVRLNEQDPSAYVQSEYIRKNAGYPVYENTIAEYFQVGDDMFPALIEELEKARHFIFMEYFIINDGIMWQTILGILERKVKEGVDVRVMYDDFGCLTTLPHKYYKELRRKGIKCEAFNKFLPVLSVIQNNRNHRKLCIIDGHTGFTGGINLADEYINQKNRFGHWKDTAVMLKGDGVWNMTVMFLQMWAVITRSKEGIHYEEYQPQRYHEGGFASDGFVQPFSDTPLDREVVGENVYLNIINRAKKYVYICTPYLIIDNEMMTALCLAAKNGIDVKIMTPGIPDKKLVFLLTQSYYAQLIQAGVEIYEYQPGFLHAKSFLCDDEIAVVGTINLDYRSLYLHFEDGVWMYKNHIIDEMKQDFVVSMNYCKKVSTEFCESRGAIVSFMQSILRLFAPML